MAYYDTIGNIAIIKSEHRTRKEVNELAKKLLVRHGITTVFEKIDKFSGRLRTIKVKHLAGVKTTEALYKENGCLFKLDVDKAYFSPRLANERQKIAGKIKKTDRVLVMFAGVAPYSVVLAKLAKPKRIVSIELGKLPSKYAKENVKMNHVEKIVEVIQGDVKKQIPKLKEKFDVIVMARPNLKDTFLEDALKVSKKGTRIFYYGFSHVDDKNAMVEELKDQAKKLKRKIKIGKVLESGDIAPFKFRYRVEIKVL